MRLKEIMKDREIGVLEVAEECGVEPFVVQHMLDGKATVEQATLVAQGLRVTLDELVLGVKANCAIFDNRDLITELMVRAETAVILLEKPAKEGKGTSYEHWVCGSHSSCLGLVTQFTHDLVNS